MAEARDVHRTDLQRQIVWMEQTIAEAGDGGKRENPTGGAASRRAPPEDDETTG